MRTPSLLLAVWLLSHEKLYLVLATCSVDDAVCQLNAGSCSSAVTAFFAGSLEDALGALSYGRYCGRNSECRPIEGTTPPNASTCIVDTPDCPPPPCDGVDAACLAHDMCLGGLIQSLNMDPPPIPERCNCEMSFAASLGAVVMNSSSPTGLCDAAFYQTSVMNQTISHMYLASAMRTRKIQIILYHTRKLRGPFNPTSSAGTVLLFRPNPPFLLTRGATMPKVAAMASAA